MVTLDGFSRSIHERRRENSARDLANLSQSGRFKELILSGTRIDSRRRNHSFRLVDRYILETLSAIYFCAKEGPIARATICESTSGTCRDFLLARAATRHREIKLFVWSNESESGEKEGIGVWRITRALSF